RMPGATARISAIMSGLPVENRFIWEFKLRSAWMRWYPTGNLIGLRSVLLPTLALIASSPFRPHRPLDFVAAPTHDRADTRTRGDLVDRAPRAYSLDLVGLTRTSAAAAAGDGSALAILGQLHR